MKTATLPRRSFLKTTILAASGCAPLFHRLPLWGAQSANARLNVACIGLGGQMQGLIQETITLEQNIVALCDVDQARIQATLSAFPDALARAAKYNDFRKLLAQEKSIDAVIIATPDHWHAIISQAAMEAGKAVYCEKPLTHTVGEARAIAQAATKTKVVTQTGNQGSSSSNFRRSMELIQANLLGTVTDVHIWHPPHGWPNGVDRPADNDPIPPGLDWNFWLGPAPERAYKGAVYHPGAWRGWYDFGGGSLADFCCHAFSMPVRALNLDAPEGIEVSGVALAKDSFPKSCAVHFRFPPRGKRGPVNVHFYTGGDLPPASATVGLAETYDKIPGLGCLVVGEKGTLSAGLWNNECFLRMQDEKEFQPAQSHDAAKAVPLSLPRAPRDRHMLEWIAACKGDGQTFSPFQIGAHITGIGAIGLLGLRLGRSIEWDARAMQVRNAPETAAWIAPQHRGEWTL